MKGVVMAFVCILLSVSVSNTRRTPQPFNSHKKLFVITLDGFRWQELFGGADSALIHDPGVTADTAINKALYWAATPGERRRKLMPFTWSIIAKQGQLFGNRWYNNKVNVSNPYSLSYPGYNEILTGGVDMSIYSNDKNRNSNRNVLDALNGTPAYKGRVAAFTSWDVFPYILNKKESHFYINSGLQNIEGKSLSASEKLVNAIQNEMMEKAPTRYDELTFIACKEYLLKQKPSVLFLSFSGTDDAGHQRSYSRYLQQANNADHMIGELWSMVQSMPEYAGTTTFLITTDHGRGSKTENWSRHGFFVPGSSQTWFALLGSGIVPGGEMKMENQAYQRDLKKLMLEILTLREGK